MRKFLRRKSDDVVFYPFALDEAVEIDENGLKFPFVSPRMTSADFELVEDAGPETFVGKCMSLKDGTWTIKDQEAYDSALESLASEAEANSEKEAEAQKEQSQRSKRKAKMEGIEILGVMCSATKDDQNGLNALATAIMRSRFADKIFPPTEFEFENGSKLVITNDNFDELESVWTPFRQSFFQP